MATQTPQPAGAVASPTGNPDGATGADEQPVVTEEALIEEVSIDGMCGVY